MQIVGIDEVGRGPLAGPVVLGAVTTGPRFNKNFFKGIKDSKKLSLEDRELWFDLAIRAHANNDLDFSVSFVSEKVIDKIGITKAIQLGIKRCLNKLDIPVNSQIFLDGSLKAPEEYIHQLTVVRGDEKIPVISLASIMAKVMRDRYMVKLSKKYPEYHFDIHKGYGTELHRTMIKKYGASPVHRRSFLKNIET
jgi:ribonuclease HII